MHTEALTRRLLAEGLGSLLLTATVVGSGIMAERLAGGSLAIALIANTGATVAVLATLISLLGPLSGGRSSRDSTRVEPDETSSGKLTLSAASHDNRSYALR
jgi:hypothetical protein